VVGRLGGWVGGLAGRRVGGLVGWWVYGYGERKYVSAWMWRAARAGCTGAGDAPFAAWSWDVVGVRGIGTLLPR
jgi:hypothetical protein